MLAEPDPTRLLGQFAAAIRPALERQAELFEVVWQAAGEPEIAALDQRASLGRWHDMRQVAQTLVNLVVW